MKKKERNIIAKDTSLPVGFGDDFFELYGGQGQHFIYDLVAKDYGRLSIIWGGEDTFYIKHISQGIVTLFQFCHM